MVTFEIGAALLAGLVGTLAMTVLMQVATAMRMTRMPSMPLIQGLMVTGNRARAQLIGSVTHVIVMGAVVFGLVYAALFTALDDTSAAAGILIGAVHGIVAGLVMAMMGAVHPRMDPPPLGGADEPVTLVDGEPRLVEPGLFARNYGGMTPVGLVLGHAVYGLVVALVYGAVA